MKGTVRFGEFWQAVAEAQSRKVGCMDAERNAPLARGDLNPWQDLFTARRRGIALRIHAAYRV